MISFALLECGADPSFVVGGTVPQLGGGSRSGSGPAFVAEACEFDRSFHHLRPARRPHHQHRGRPPRLLQGHRRDRRKLPRVRPARPRPTAWSSPTAKTPAWPRRWQGITTRVRAGRADAGAGLEHTAAGHRQRLSHAARSARDGKPVGELGLSVAGEHNLFNATMAVAACAACGVPPDRPSAAAEPLHRRRPPNDAWSGTSTGPRSLTITDTTRPKSGRRSQALREQYEPRRAVLRVPAAPAQPDAVPAGRFRHQLRAGRRDDRAGHLFRPRQRSRSGTRSAPTTWSSRVRDNGQGAVHLPNFADIVRHLRAVAGEGDLVVTMGAGNVWEIGRDLVGG